MSALLAQHLKPLRKYLERPGLIELCVNKPGEIHVETVNGWERVADPTLSLETLRNLAAVLATVSGQVFSDAVPFLATALPGYGYRVQVVGGSVAQYGIAISIRVGTALRFDLETYMDEAEAAKLREAVRTKKNILIAGGTSSGKTTFFNSLIREIPPGERVVKVEDTPELIVEHANSVGLYKSKSGTDVGKVSYRDIINALMRMRPDRILMGELDIENTVPFIRLLNTGHGGSMATIHADSTSEALEAVVMNAQLAGMQGPVRDWAMMSLDVLVHLTRETRRKFLAKVEYIDG